MRPYVRPEPGHNTVIDIAGQKLELRYPLSALKKLEKTHGISLLKGPVFGEVMQSPSLLSALLLAGLQPRQPDITEEWVDEHLDAPEILRLGPYIIYAVSGNWDEKLIRTLEGFAAPADPLGETPPAASNSTGSPSGPSDATILVSANANSGG
jgi:hypothetical protein